jgi:hypothetical protein
MAIIKKGNFAFNERKLQGMKNLIGHGFMGHDEAQIVIIIYSAAVVALFLQLQNKLGPFIFGGGRICIIIYIHLLIHKCSSIPTFEEAKNLAFLGIASWPMKKQRLSSSSSSTDTVPYKSPHPTPKKMKECFGGGRISITICLHLLINS